MAKNDIEQKVRSGCRAGDPDALRAAAYQLADELYAAALSALGSDEHARTAVAETWQLLLAALRWWRCGGGLRRRSLWILRRVLAKSAAPEQLRWARIDRGAEHAPEVAAAPADLVRELVTEGERMAPILARAARRRRRSVHVGLAVSAFAVGLLLGFGNMLYGRALSRHSPQLQFATLQQRIVAAALPAAIQEAYLDLMDPEGAQAVQAEAYQRIRLVLEEISNAASLQETRRLQFVKHRIAAQDLISIARSAAEQSQDKRREKLMLVVLVLEEAANL